MLYHREHPSFPDMPEVADLLARGFIDQSWHNDTCPGFERGQIKVWIEHPNADQRENPERYCVDRLDDDGISYGDSLLYIGDSWSEALAIIDAQ